MAILTDPQGIDLIVTDAEIRAITEIAEYIRPRAVGDVSTSLSVYVYARRAF